MSEDKNKKRCVLCEGPEDEVGGLIKIPGGLEICSKCLQSAMSMVDAFSKTEQFPHVNHVDPSAKRSTPAVPVDEDSLIASSESETNPKEEENKPDEGDNKKDSVKDMPGFQNIGFLNLSDIQNMFFGGGAPKVKKADKDNKTPVIDIKNIPLPHKIKESLDEYVVGQEMAKRVMSVAVYNHYKRVAAESMDKDSFDNELSDVEIEKSNVLLIGPTGCGKTYLVKTLAKLLDVPLAITDATSLTEAGYIGDDIESVVSKLLSAADNDVDRAECGIIFIDEIDKIAKKKNSHSRDVSGESVQQGMLKLLEGAEVEVPVGANSKNAMVPLTKVDTRNILFICGGAFPDLDEIIKQRLRKQTSIGFNAELRDSLDKKKDILKEVTVEDIKKFGMIPEFVGRLPVICTMDGLSEDMLVDILSEPKNAILKQYRKLLAIDEVKLEFTEGALHAIAKKAMEKDTGARALRAIIEDLMLDIMFEIPKDDNIGVVTITEDYVAGKGGPIVDMRGGMHV